MRPGQLRPGNKLEQALEALESGRASMRPGQLRPGNGALRAGEGDPERRASMRPGQLRPGNPRQSHSSKLRTASLQ